ncbi:unnamed protein product [Ectocarpus sp. 4 AP-2014]
MPPDGPSATAGGARVSNADGSKGSAWSRFHGKINKVADNFFYRLGYWVATHPKRTLLISLVFVIACCLGFANFRVEADGEDLWVPADSLTKQQEEIILEDFDGGGEFASFLVESPSETGSVLTKESVDAIWELDAIVMAVEVDGNTYADVCLKELDGVTCEQPFRGITRFWGDFDTYEASVSNDADVLAAVNATTFPDGSAVNQQALFGNGITYDDDGNISGATAIIQAYALDSDSDEDVDINENVYDWNEAFQNAMDAVSDDFDVFGVFYLTSRSTDDAISESVSGEIYLFVIAYVLMIAFVSVTIGRCCRGHVKQRSWLAIGGIIFVIAAGVAAYGVNSGFGVPFTTLSQMLPFILVGIGVDDMFVIVAAYDNTDPLLAVEERVALGIKRCGVSITSFVALLTIDAKRQRAGRIDCYCCLTSERHLQQEERQHQEGIQRGVTLPASNGESANNTQLKHDDEADVHQLSTIGRFMKDKYAPFVLSAKGKALVLLASAGLLAAGIYGVTQASQGLDVLDLAPDGHFSIEYTVRSRYYDFDIQEWYVPINVYTQEVDYPDVAVQVR